MPTVKILRGTVANGEHQEPGSVVDLAADEALRIVAMGKAAYIDGSEAKGASLESLVSEAAAPAKKGRK